MALMLWGDWEENGYHDSYFFAAVWDTEKGECVSMATGATAYAGGIQMPDTVAWTADELERARLWLKGKIFDAIRAAEHKDVLEPENVVKGQRVRLLEPHKNQAFERITVDCPNCGGTGYWQNPHNAADKRTCFKCQGKKQIETKGAKLKGQWIRFDTGKAGEAKFDAEAHGQFYANGYNKKGRHNRTVTILLDDGRWMKAPLKKLRFDKEPMSDTELMVRADDLSYHMDPKSLLTKHKGWWSSNFAAGLMKQQRDQREMVV